MIETFRRTVGTTAELLYAHPRTAASGEGDYPNKRIVLINASSAQTDVTLGPQGVTAATGARWIVDAGRTFSVELEVGEALYAIVAAGSQSVDVLTGGR